MDDWKLYLIRTKTNALYTGITTDVERRFSEHCAGGSKSARYLRGKGPLALVWHQAVGSKSRAAKLECKVKKLSKAQKEKLVSGLIELNTLVNI